MPERALAEPKPVRGAPLVQDPEPDRAAAIRAIVSHIAPRLGLRVDQLRIYVDADANRLTQQHSASGLQHRGGVYLRPGDFDPRTRRGRYLLGHELAHAAQRRVVAPPTPTEHAEAEAHAIGEAIADARQVDAPVRHLTEDVPARAVDANQLQAIVANTRRREIDRIYHLLDRILWISDTDVDNVLLTLQDMDFFTARAVIASHQLDKLRVDLIDNINDHHYARFRAEILACYAACSPAELRRFDEQLLTGLDLRSLTDDEHYAVFHVFHNLRPSAHVALLKSDKAYEIKLVLARDPGLNVNEEKRLQDAHDAEAKRNEEEVQDKWRLFRDPQLEADRRFVLDKMNDVFVSDAKALSVLDLLAKYVYDQDKMRALAREMEDAGALDRLIRELPIKALFEEYVPKTGHKATVEVPRRKAFLMLLSLRPPYKNVQLATELTPTGFFEKVFSVVTDEDAYLAFQLIKAVPQKSRRSFMEAEKGEHWERTMAEMTQQMRESAAMNFYTGGKGQLDRATFELPLLDDAVWSHDRLQELDGRIRMAIAAGDHRFAWEQSERVGAYRRRGLEAVVEKYRLYNPNALGPDGKPKPRTEYSPEVLEGTAFWQEGAFDTLALVGRGLDLAFQPEFSLGSIDASHLSTDDIQKLMGGSVAGIRFKTQDEIQQQERGRGQSRGGANFFDRIVIDMSIGKLEVESAALEIAAIRYFYGDLLIQTGESRLQNLKVQAGYPKSGGKNAYYMRVDVDAVDLHDVLLISPDSMTSVSTVSLRGVRMTSASEYVDYNTLGEARTDTLQFPILSPIAGLIRVAANAKDLRRAFRQTGQLSVTADSIRLQGVTLSSGQHIQSLDIGSVAYRAGDSIVGYQRALEESYRSFPARLAAEQQALDAGASDEDRAQHADAIKQLEKRRVSVEKALRVVHADLAKIKTLEDRRKASGVLSPDDERKLNRLQRGGATFDVSSLQIHGITGAATAGDIDLYNLHGHGQLAQYEPPTEDRPSGKDLRPVIASLDDPSGLAIEVGNFRTRGLELKASPPSAESLAAEIKRIEERLAGKPPGHETTRKLALLRDTYAEVAEFERLARIGPADLSDSQRQRLRTLRQKLFEQPSLRIADVSLEGAVVGLDFAGGFGALADLRANLKKATLSADAVRLKDVTVASTGAHVETITATALKTGLTRRDKDATMGLEAAGIVVEGVNLKRTEQSLREQKARLEKGLTPLSKADQRRLDLISSALHELDVLGERVEAAYRDLDRAFGTFGEERAAARVKVAEAAIEAWQTQLVAQGISVTNLNLSLTDLGDVLSPEYDIESVLRRGVRATASFDEAEITGANTAGAGARSVKLRAAAGSVVYGADAIDVKDFRLGSIDVTGLNYAGGGRRIWSDRTTKLQGVTANARIRYSRTPAGEVAATVAIVDDFVIQSVIADDLHFQDTSGAQAVDVEIQSGALNVVGVHDFVAIIPDDPDSQTIMLGSAGIGSVDKLKVVAALEGGLKASGTINARGLTAQFGRDGEQEFRLDDLDVLGGEISQRGSKVKVEVRHLKGGVKRNRDGSIDFDIPSLDTVRVPLIDWRAGAKSVAGTDLVLSQLDARGRMSKDGAVVVNRFGIGKVDAKYLRYSDRDSDLLVEVRAEDAASGLRIDRIELTDLHWSPKTGVTSAKLDVGHIASSLAVSMGKELQMGVKLDASGLNVQLSKGGKIAAKVEDLSADVDGTAAGAKIRMSVSGVKAAGSLEENRIVIDELKVGMLRFTRLSYDTPKFELIVSEALGGDVRLLEASAAVTVNLNPRPKPGELPPGAKPPPRLASVEINRFTVPTITGTGLIVALKGPGMTLSVGRGNTLTLNNLQVTGPKADAGGPFVIRPKDGNDWELLGAATLASANIDKLALDMIGAFHATAGLRAEGGRLEFSPKGTRVDLASASLSDIQANIAGAGFVLSTGGPGQVGVKSVDVKGLHVDESSAVGLDRVSVGGLKFDHPALGVHLDIQRASLPKGMSLHPGETVQLDQLDIEEAKFTIDDVMSLGGGGGRSSFVPTDYRFLDRLSGHVNADVMLDIDWVPNQMLPMRIRIRSGRIDYDAIERQLPALVNQYVDFKMYEDTGLFSVEMGVASNDPFFQAPIPPSDLPRALRSHEIKLSVLVNGKPVATPSPRSSPIKRVNVTNIDARLNLWLQSELDFGPAGKIRFGGPGLDGVVGLTARGNILSGSTGVVNLGLEEANVGLDNLVIGGARLAVDRIQIKNVDPEKTRLHFRRLRPEKLEGVIASATAENITVFLPRKSD